MDHHAQVNVTLWLDHYMKEIYPNWVHNRLGLSDFSGYCV